MSWAILSLHQSVLSLLQIISIEKQVAQATQPTAPVQGKSANPPEKKPVETTEKSQAKSSYEEAYEKEKKRCRTSSMGSKVTVYMTCLDEARRRLKNPPKPRPAQTPLQKELASCEMRGKPAQIWQCKNEAPAKVERQRKEAAETALRESKLSPEQKVAENYRRALNSCSALSKSVQINQCRMEAKEKFGVK